MVTIIPTQLVMKLFTWRVRMLCYFDDTTIDGNVTNVTWMSHLSVYMVCVWIGVSTQMSGLTTLQTRKLRADMEIVCKIVRGIGGTDEVYFFQ